MNRDYNLRTMPGQGLIDTVINGLINQMMQAASGGIAYVHRGSLANRLETLQNLNGSRVISLF